MIDKAVFALPGVRAALAVLVVLAAARALAVVGQAWGLASALVALWGGASLASQGGWIALFIGCFIGRKALVCVQDAYLDRYASARADELRSELLRTVFAQGAAVVQDVGTGSVTALVLEGVDQVETYIRLILPKAVGVVVVPLVLLVWIAPLDWVSGCIALVAFPFIILYMVILGHTAQDEAARQHATFQALSNRFVDSLRGLDTLKLLGRAAAHGASIREASERFREATMATLRVATLSSAVLDLFATGSLAAVAIMLGFRLVDGTLAFFPALVVLVLVPEYFRPVRDFAADYHASLDGKNALVSIRGIVDGCRSDAKEQTTRPTEVSTAANVVDNAAASSVCVVPTRAVAPVVNRCDSQPAIDSALTTGATALPRWDARSSLEVRNACFSYPGYQALSDVSFRVEGLARVGIVGASGAGKSTLVSLLGGFTRPSAGSFKVCGCTVNHLQRDDWQRQALYMPQRPYVFHATLRENIAFYRPDADTAAIERAVEAVGLSQLVSELPDGLDAVVGEGGRTLSGGQAQRVALARALMDGSRRILLFDEPTAHLDIETEYELKERMLPLMEGRLVFFATHRLHWMRDMDLVVVMEDGRVVEVGEPDELRCRGGAFARLATLAQGGAL